MIPIPPKTKRLLGWLPGLIGLAILIVAVVSHEDEGRKLIQALRDLDPVWIGIAVLLQLGTYLCSALVWRWTLSHQGVRLSLRAMMKLGVKKLFTDQVIPTGGIGGTVLITRSLLKQKIPPEKATTGVVANFYSYYAAYAVSVFVSLFILWANHSINPLVQKISLFFLVVVLAIVFTAWKVTHAKESRLRTFLEKKAFIKKFLDILRTSSPKIALKPRVLLPNMIFQAGVFVLDTATLYILLMALDQSASFSLLFASFMMAYVVETLGPIPGGIGIFESSAVAMLSLSHVPLSTALAATLLLRSLTFWLPMIPGLILIKQDL